jgi:hypothetical protein
VNISAASASSCARAAGEQLTRAGDSLPSLSLLYLRALLGPAEGLRAVAGVLPRGHPRHDVLAATVASRAAQFNIENGYLAIISYRKLNTFRHLFGPPFTMQKGY